MAKNSKNQDTIGDSQELAIAIEQLTDELRAALQSIDELRDDVVWAVRNLIGNLPPQPPTILSSMPADPTAADWPDRLNRFSSNGDPEPLPTLSARAFIWPDDSAERARFCCESPELEWTGDSDDPSIVCAACGEIVAVLPESRTERQIQDVMARYQASLEAAACDQATNYNPEIVCNNCGDVVTEQGNLISCSSTDVVAEHQLPAELPVDQHQQGTLFQ
jgi:hypothetical protein